jgi:hypothetical protein
MRPAIFLSSICIFLKSTIRSVVGGFTNPMLNLKKKKKMDRNRLEMKK